VDDYEDVRVRRLRKYKAPEIKEVKQEGGTGYRKEDVVVPQQKVDASSDR
jgi:hypothetical protein